MISGLKVIAAELERLAAAHGLRLREFTTSDVYKLCHRKHDPIPAFKKWGKGAGIYCDESALECWFKRQRFTFSSSAIGESDKHAG